MTDLDWSFAVGKGTYVCSQPLNAIRLLKLPLTDWIPGTDPHRSRYPDVYG